MTSQGAKPIVYDEQYALADEILGGDPLAVAIDVCDSLLATWEELERQHIASGGTWGRGDAQANAELARLGTARRRLDRLRSPAERRLVRKVLREVRLSVRPTDALCVYCGAPSYGIDHVIPASRGGGHGPDNLVPACAPCNTEKGARTLAEWMRDLRNGASA